MPSTLALDSRLLAAVEDLPLLAETLVEGFLDGLHRSPFLGYSTEFSAYRSYTQGDNLRHLDWKVWARTDALYVKQFEDETNVRGQIFLDVSASMDFGQGGGNKFAVGRMLAAALAQLMVRQRDAPGLVLFGPETRQALPASATRQQAVEIFTLLSQAQARGATALGADLFRLVQGFSRRGMAVVISDFLTAETATFELLQQLQAARQETLVFHLLAPEELDFPYHGQYLVEDVETGEEVWVDADTCRRGYQERLAAFGERIRASCLGVEADYQRLRTDQPLDGALVAYLERRLAV